MRGLWRTSVLVKYQGTLCMMEVNPAGFGPGRCPSCGGTSFREGMGWDAGWLECQGVQDKRYADEGCDFAICKSHIEQIESQMSGPPVVTGESAPAKQ